MTTAGPQVLGVGQVPRVPVHPHHLRLALLACRLPQLQRLEDGGPARAHAAIEADHGLGALKLESVQMLVVGVDGPGRDARQRGHRAGHVLVQRPQALHLSLHKGIMAQKYKYMFIIHKKNFVQS